MNRGLAWGLALLGGLGAGFGGLYLYERLRTPTSTTSSGGGGGGTTIIYYPPPTPSSGQPSSGQPSSGQPSSGQPSSSGQQTTNCATQLANGQLYLQEGNTGACVHLVQQLLNEWGMAYGYGGFAGSGPLTVDGDFGPLTQQAVEAFQQREGISVDGVVGPQTWGRLSQMTPPSSTITPTPPTGTLNPIGSCATVELALGTSGSCVQQLQQDLQTIANHVVDVNGNPVIPAALALTVDGQFGSLTQQAVQQFQQVVGLPANGVVGAQTWAAIGAFLVGVQQQAPPTQSQVNSIAGQIGGSALAVAGLIYTVAALMVFF